jgi:hypothetical protein
MIVVFSAGSLVENPTYSFKVISFHQGFSAKAYHNTLYGQ